MRNFLSKIFLACLVAAFAVGCGGSDDFGNPSGLQQSSQGIRVQISAQELANLFPPVAGQTINPNIVEFQVFAFDASGAVAASATVPNDGTDLDLILIGLQLANFDVVLAGVDANGNVVAAYQAADIAPVPGGLQVIGAEVFRPLEGFVLPDGNQQPVDGNISINVTVTEVNGEYEVSWDGEPARAVSAIPVDLVEALAADPLNTDLQTRLSTEAFTITATPGNSLTSPVVLTLNQTISGAIINNNFAGFTGVTYRVTVDRENGDTGFVDIVLTARS